MAQHSSLRTLVYSVCVLQLLTSAERQVFDLLGYMWLPILGNFLNIIFVIFCIFGVNQRKPNYVSSYSIWSLVWIAWNAFVTCYYMEVGSLDRREDVLSLGTNSFSWWLANGYGCRPVYYHNISNELIIDAMERNVYHPLRPSEVNGCLMEYYFVEVIHAGVQVILAALGASAGFYLVYLLVSDRQKRQGTPQKALYSIEYSPQVSDTTNLGGGGPDTELYANAAVMKENQGHMTPRRVKRRSYTRSSARSAKSLSRTKRSAAASRAYSSMGRVPKGGKSSGSINPVTRLLELDPASQHARQRHATGAEAAAASAGLDSSTSNDIEQAYGQVNPAYESSRPNSIYSSSTANGPGIVSRQPGGGGGHSDRPPSALTSYSNFHGQRKQAPNHFTGINLTQDTFVQPPPAQNQSAPNPSGGAGNQNAQLNTSFDDLPPPPPPIAEDADIAPPPPPLLSAGGRSARPQAPLPAAPSPSLAGAPQSSPRLPVPQQRNPKRNEHVEYVNTVSQHLSSAPQAQVQQQQQQQQQLQHQRIQQHQQLQQPLDSSLSSDVNNYNDDPGNMQTLRANDRLILPPPRNASTENSTRYYKSAVDTPDASTGARAKQYNGYGVNGGPAQNDRIPNGHGRPPARPPTGMRNGYGHSGGGGGMYHDRALPPQPNSLSNGAPSSEDDYGFTSMPPTSRPQTRAQAAPPAEHDYMRDPMKPVGAKMHGGNCKCYRCQRKLTAI